MGYVLGIDLGTSSLKGLVVDKKGKIIAAASSNYSLFSEQTGYSEQDPNNWIQAAEQVLQNLPTNVRAEIEGISFSGQMHSLVLVDHNNQVVRPSILWNDGRTTQQCQEIMADYGEELLQQTKNIALEGFTLPKILWIQKNEPEIWAQTAKILLPKDYLRYWFDGRLATEHSDAAGTLMLDIHKNSWSKELIARFDIAEDQLPELVESLDQTGFVSPKIQERYGLKSDVKVFAGGADNACAALGAGLHADDQALVSIGTSGVFLTLENEVEVDYKGRLHFFDHVISAVFYTMGVTLSAGYSLAWFKETFAPDVSFDELLQNISKVPPGARGLLFTPYIVGERTPHIDSQIRGSFIGINQNHRLSDFTRAVLEGITFSLKDSQVLMEQTAKKKFKEIISLGGGAKNATWLQIQADIFNTTIVSLETEEGPGIGAAMLAAIGCGWFKTVEECIEVFVKYKKRIVPNPENAAYYQTLYPIYRCIYNSTKAVCHELQGMSDS